MTSDERRYGEAEVAAIFRQAASDAQAASPLSAEAQDGLTLAELQSIAHEVGVTADAVTRAALSLDMRGQAAEQRRFGLPIGVSRTVELRRKLSDDEWERLVVRLRDVFDAMGTTRGDGGLRQWSNGNLHVRLEPTETGQRLYFRTVNGRARAYFTAGTWTLAASAGFLLLNLVTGASDPLMPFMAAGLVGAGCIAAGAFGLTRWADRRARQMQRIAVEAFTLARTPLD